MKLLIMMGIISFAVFVTGCDKGERSEQKKQLETTKLETVGTGSTNLQVTKWGPQSTNAGTVLNKQRNGSMGIWVLASGAQELGKVQVLFDGQAVRTVVSGKGISAAVPPEQIAKPGNKEVVIKQIETGKIFPVGTFAVKP